MLTVQQIAPLALASSLPVQRSNIGAHCYAIILACVLTYDRTKRIAEAKKVAQTSSKPVDFSHAEAYSLGVDSRRTEALSRSKERLMTAEDPHFFEIERQALLADQQAVRDLLARLPESDPLGRLSLEARLRDIDAELAKLDAAPDATGSVALVFGGAPVQGSRSIDADFAARAIHEFQELVAKRIAKEESGKLGSRGPIPLRSVVNLGITDMLRGSVGFALEETGLNHEIAPTSLKKAIDDVAHMVASTASENVADFEGTLETLDDRLLVSLRDFFRTLDEKHATLRIIESEREVHLDVPSIHRGRERIDTLQITDQENDNVVGELIGLLPGSRRFEMKLVSGEIIRGGVAADVAPLYMELIGTPDQAPVGRTWRTKMRVRVVQQRNKPPRTLYTLAGLLERVS